jgi:hypothetical protein
MFRCIYTLTDQETSDGEHVLQNFLGARWTSERIVSNDLQRSFGTGIDVDMEQVLQPIRNRLGTKSGRGGEGPTIKRLLTSRGQEINLRPGGAVEMASPVLEEIDLGDGKKHVRIQAASKQHIAWALAQIREKYPNTNIDMQELLQQATVTESYIDDSVAQRLDIGGPELFRGLLKSCFNLLGVIHNEIALMPCFDGVRVYVRDGSGKASDYVRWYGRTECPCWPRLGPADHHIFIASRGASVEGVAQLFGNLVYPFRLTATYAGPDLRCGYIVDPFRESQPAEIRNPEFDVAMVPIFSEQEDDWNEKVEAAHFAGLGRIVELYYARSRQAMILRSIKQVAQAHGGETFTEEMVRDFVEIIVQRLFRQTRNLGPFRKK